MERIFQNLLKNILIHGKDYLSVTFDQENKQIIFKNQVSNKNDLEVERLFERFYTTDVSRSSKRTGLGLAIAKELINQMKGEIFAQLDDDMLSIIIKLETPK